MPNPTPLPSSIAETNASPGPAGGDVPATPSPLEPGFAFALRRRSCRDCGRSVFVIHDVWLDERHTPTVDRMVRVVPGQTGAADDLVVVFYPHRCNPSKESPK